MAAGPETGLITDCEMTMATGDGSSDADSGAKMPCRDRFHDGGTATGDGPAAGPGTGTGI